MTKTAERPGLVDAVPPAPPPIAPPAPPPYWPDEHPPPSFGPPPRKRDWRSVFVTFVAAVTALLVAFAVVLSGQANREFGTLAPPAPSASGGTGTSAVENGLVYVNSVLGYRNAAAAGTGMLLTSDGIILTNNHVIDGATSITVAVLSNLRTYSATVVGTDPSHDIAVLQLQGARGLSTMPTGDSDTARVGDLVVAIGNGDGDGGVPDVASGRITALNQTITTDGSNGESLEGLIETDADVISGFSGGALAKDGKVIGVVTAASTAGAAPGVPRGELGTDTDGYAIPIDAALAIAQRILDGENTAAIH